MAYRSARRIPAGTTAIGLMLALGACNGDDHRSNGNDATSGSSTQGDSAGDEDPHLTSDFEPLCMPETTRCAGGGFLEKCADTADRWVSAACPANTECRDCEGEGCPAVPACVGECDLLDGLPSSYGCEFIANRQLHTREDLPDAIVVANPDKDAPATVSLYQIENGTNVEVLVETVTLAPGEDKVWEMTNDFVPGLVSRLRSGGMFRIRSDFPIAAYQHSPFQNSGGNDSALLLPDTVLGQTYVVPSYNPYPAKPEFTDPSYFEVVSLSRDTWIEWTPPVPTFGLEPQIKNVLAGKTGRHNALNRYDTLRITASNEYDEIPLIDRDLSGTVITSNNPIWVVGAIRCTHVPASEDPGFCDPLQEVLIPVAHWGTTYVAAHPPVRDDENHYWRIYAGGRDTTTFRTEPNMLSAENCAPPAVFEDPWCTLPKRGAWIEIEADTTESFVVEGQPVEDTNVNAIMVVGYLQGARLPSEDEVGTAPSGDPSMYQMVPVEQFLRRYLFRTAIGYEDYVQLIRPVTSTATVFVDDMGVSGWTQVGAYEFVNHPIGSGVHDARSADVFGVIQFGYSRPYNDPDNCLQLSGPYCRSSYAHPGGMKSQPIWIP